MTGLGCVAAFSLFVGDIPEAMTYEWLASFTTLVLSAAATGYIWFVGDEQRAQRKIFTRKLDSLENKLLELKAQGAAS